MKVELATIETDIGTMIICYNGSNQAMTAENAEDRSIAETLDFSPKTIPEACDQIYGWYAAGDWCLRFIWDGFEGYDTNDEEDW